MRILVILSLIICTSLHAQRVVNVDQTENVDRSMLQVVNGEPFSNTKFVRLVSGSPYFKDQWLRGKLTTPANQIFNAGVYKLDLVDNNLHFLDNGKEKIATTAFKKVELTDSVTGENFVFIHSSFLHASAKKGWYLQLLTGKASLYLYYDKQIMENRPYNSATTEQSVRTVEQFLLLAHNSFTLIKKVKNPVTYFPDHQDALQTHWNKSQGSTEEKLKSLVTYYNSL